MHARKVRRRNIEKNAEMLSGDAAVDTVAIAEESPSQSVSPAMRVALHADDDDEEATDVGALLESLEQVQFGDSEAYSATKNK